MTRVVVAAVQCAAVAARFAAPAAAAARPCVERRDEGDGAEGPSGGAASSAKLLRLRFTKQ